MDATITAAVLNTAPGPLRLEELRLDEPTDREVRVRVAAAGICHSDLHEIDGTFPTQTPIVLGHEAAGVVEAVGSAVTGFRPGDHVVSCLSVFCGECRYCTNGQLVLCTKRGDLSHRRPRPRLRNAAGQAVRPTAGIGAFATSMLVHENALVGVPADIPPATASILGCAVTTGLGAVLRTAAVRPGQDVVVLGAGGIGLAAVQGARLAGAARIIAVDIHAAKLDAARHCGATAGVDARHVDPVAAVRELTDGGADHVLEAVGTSRTVMQALEMLRPGGTATVIGMVPGGRPVEIQGTDFFLQEKRLQGSFMGSNQFKVDIPRYIELNRQGRLMLDELVTHTVTLETINEGVAILAAGEATRVVTVLDAA
ncbi:Zn-dependent alcohol dehydrogenase [Nakamurella endophytica]|uniref:Alcohol dehydrogenase n=1 Tax=Nakamurella endophytica TaxID=1748367 RepID=A0A917SYJ6_9ACTN|nr:Zn-dependent alcohol dehydrogenase [Nakamurella endophytica]GGM04586.1 alcohol dehydrogenase [Nakamurella endophytica]